MARIRHDVLTFQDALDRLRGRNRCKLAPNTYLHHNLNEPLTCHIALHGTYVVSIHADGTYTLNSGGGRTVTTKNRINTYSPVRVCQCKGEWLVYYHGVEYSFQDGMIIHTKLQ